MISFLDGPAAGRTLAPKRAPAYLRVVHGKEGWDALDQLEDEPRPGEELFAYCLVSRPTAYHLLCGRGRRGNASGWYWNAEYRVVDPQPDQATLANTDKWRAWATVQKAPTSPAAAEEPPA